jgi:hypothetical protein
MDISTSFIWIIILFYAAAVKYNDSAKFLTNLLRILYFLQCHILVNNFCQNESNN